ncbi:MAG TPA: sigma-70 family RNA polymerase sigma factor [Pirellulales bacterium]|jgi:RNA polymerase sigma-70 factor (ECF subfamily)|nr:sigma-70 family RNA polymerase sigma factor [Pirellulales bacterium]
MEDALDDTAGLERSLHQLKASEGEAFDQARDTVIEHASSRLERLVHRMLRNYPRLRRWEETGDVLQNAVLRLHRSLATVRPESARQFYGLAAAQIRRELIDLTRHHFGPRGEAAKHHTDGPQAGDDGLVANQPDLSGEPASLAEWTEFHEAVRRLPEAEREVFELHWYEGLDQKKVAAILGVSDRTIKNRWRNAKLSLRRMLTGDDSK